MRGRFRRIFARRGRAPGIASLSTGGGVGLSDQEIAEFYRLPEGINYPPNATGAQWIEDSIGPGAWATVRGLVPETFDRYARVLHPAYDREGLPGVRWSDVARGAGREVHPLMQFERIAGLGDDPNDQPSWGREPSVGDVCPIVSPIANILRQHTATPEDITFAIWEGYGGLSAAPQFARAPRISTPGRGYGLFAGAIDSISGFCATMWWHSPSMWWPADRAWCVASEIDLDSTYIGATAACVEQILSDVDLESFRAFPHDRVDVAADERNPS